MGDWKNKSSNGNLTAIHGRQLILLYWCGSCCRENTHTHVFIGVCVCAPVPVFSEQVMYSVLSFISNRLSHAVEQKAVLSDIPSYFVRLVSWVIHQPPPPTLTPPTTPFKKIRKEIKDLLQAWRPCCIRTETWAFASFRRYFHLLPVYI